MHYTQAQETWEATPMPQMTSAQANQAQRDLLLANATREDLVAMVVLLDGELKQRLAEIVAIKADLASATFAARLNMSTIRAQQAAIRELEGRSRG
jgi:hypothetical protein